MGPLVKSRLLFSAASGVGGYVGGKAKSLRGVERDRASRATISN